MTLTVKLTLTLALTPRCTVGDHILKINGVKPNGHVEAMHQVEMP